MFDCSTEFSILYFEHGTYFEWKTASFRFIYNFGTNYERRTRRSLEFRQVIDTAFSEMYAHILCWPAFRSVTRYQKNFCVLCLYSSRLLNFSNASCNITSKKDTLRYNMWCSECQDYTEAKRFHILIQWYSCSVFLRVLQPKVLCCFCNTEKCLQLNIRFSQIILTP